MRSKSRIGQIFLLVCITSILLFGPGSAVSAADEGSIDFKKARKLFQKRRRGETLTDQEKAYLHKARQQRQKKRGMGGRGSAKVKETTGLVPLTELGKQGYKGQSGGLYGQGQNTPPAGHIAAAKKALAKIRPLDAEGKASATGKMVLISLGMSNTTQEFSKFKKIADIDKDKSPYVVIVDCAQGGMAAAQWAHPERPMRKRRPPWIVMDERIKKAGVTAGQVQAVWIKQAQPMPARLGEFPQHAQSIQKDVTIILNKLQEKFPNLRVAYLSSRIYAGYARTSLNPEPYAYESAFAVRWLIEAQIKGEAVLNYDPSRGAVKSPVLLWGPYLWADGVKSRKGDGLVYKSEDFGKDGTHPSDSGRKKVAEMLLKFFKTDPTAKGWFAKKAVKEAA
ncbi:MAG: hypothetical protein ACYTF1_01600 [Planctomycetota bacterium]|jgi:hypothetical protein